MRLAITAAALDCALGSDAEAVQAILEGQIGVAPHPPLGPLPSDLAGLAKPDYRRWLKRRKDAKLMTRAARLGLALVALNVGAVSALLGMPGAGIV